jgi:hypothetical protein
VYNPNPNPISMTWTWRFNGTGVLTNQTKIVPGRNGVATDVIPTGSGAKIVTTDTAICLSWTDTELTTADNTANYGQTHDWGFAILPEEELTPQVLIGWGYVNQTREKKL